MKIVIENLDCWNLWFFLQTCCLTNHVANLTNCRRIVILKRWLPHQELVEDENYVLMDLFYKVFDDFSVDVSPQYCVQPTDRVINESTNSQLNVSETKAVLDMELGMHLRFIRGKITRELDTRVQFQQTPKIVFISRSSNLFNDSTKDHDHWTKRSIKNNEVVKRIVRNRYFGEVFEVDKLNLPSAAEQTKVVSQADIIFGVHGAGLNWVVAAKDRAVVYEFFPKGMFQFNAMNITRNLGFKYYTKQISTEENVFDTSQIFAGLEIARRLWREQASETQPKPITNCIDFELTTITNLWESVYKKRPDSFGIFWKRVFGILRA